MSSEVIEGSKQTPPSEFFLRLAYKWAFKHSDDPDTKNGAVIVSKNSEWNGEQLNYGFMVYGYNRIPFGVTKSQARLERPFKYTFMEHAERDVIFRCAAGGHATEGATMYCPWAACADCARAIICARITKIVVHKQMMDKTPERWKQSIEDAFAMLREANVEIEYYDGVIGDCVALFDRQEWNP